MPALEHVQEKIRRNIPLTPEEKAMVFKAADSRGIPSLRRWEGIEEYPKSFIDNLDK